MKNTLVIDLDRCSGCDSCVAACKMENQMNLGVVRNHVSAVGPVGTFPDIEMYWLPMQCQQCENPGCIEVCPTGALRSFDETAEKLGVAVVQKDRCLSYFQGCTVCEDSCAFDALAFVDGHPVVDGDACNGCGQCEFECTALVYGTFAGGTRRGIVVVPPEAAGQLGRTVVEDGSEMGV